MIEVLPIKKRKEIIDRTLPVDKPLIHIRTFDYDRLLRTLTQLADKAVENITESDNTLKTSIFVVDESRMFAG